MQRNYFKRFSVDLQQLNDKDLKGLELKSQGKYLLNYVPFEHVNVQAKLVIVGITPGPNQIVLAYKAVQKLLHAGWTDEEEILMEVKKIGGFGSPTMRPNLLKILRHFNFEKILGINDVESLWSENAGLLQSTSVVPHAAFKITKSGNKMFSGSFDEVMKSDLLRECFMDCFIPTLSEINQNALYVGLGPCPQAALKWCVDHGYLNEQQVLGAFCHPATTGGSTTKYYLREVTREQLNINDPVKYRCDWLDLAYEHVNRSTSTLLKEVNATNL